MANWSLPNREIPHEPSTVPTTGLGQGGDVMIELVEHSDIPSGSKLYFDNLFTSLQLLEELYRRNLGGTGTLRENRVHKSMNLPSKQQFQKFERGKCVAVCNGQLTAMRWNDDAVVTVLSNCDCCEPTKNAQIFLRPERRREKMCKCPIQLHNTILTWVELT